MRTISCALGVAACLVASRAEADVSKAWAAAKDNLPANTQFVFAVDVAAIYKSPMFPKATEAFKSADRDINEIHNLLKTACGWDPFSVIDGIVIAGDTSQKAGVAYVQLTIDRGKATTCFESALKAIAKTKNGSAKQITVKQDGDYTVASKGNGDRDSVYFPWVGPNVVVISIAPDKKQMVDGWIKQKTFNKSLVSGMLGKLDAKAFASGAFASDKPLDAWLPITKAYANWTASAGKLSGSLVATATDAKTAKSLVDEMTKGLEKDLKRDSTPPLIKKIMTAVSITAAGSDVTIKGNVTEQDLGDALTQALAKKKTKDEASSADAAQALTMMEAFSKSMCACKDKACADKVNDSMTKWGTEMAKKSQNSKLGEADIKKATDIMTRYTECMTKVMTPQPAPKK